MLNKSLAGDRNAEPSSVINSLQAKPAGDQYKAAPRAQATNEAPHLEKKKMSKTRVDQWLPKENQRLDYDDRYQMNKHTET